MSIIRLVAQLTVTVTLLARAIADEAARPSNASSHRRK
jgi:hypothetical protein